ncbi:MFS transporter, partial [Acinetobacter baumannii]|uniref:MFS transporter n=1 Tax=Acinetobacter baumannii TaxID=470 RepID=UPI0011126942
IGWRDTYQLFGFAVLGLLMPLALLPWRLFAGGSPYVVKKTDPDFVDTGWSLLRAMRHHAFWALFSTFFLSLIHLCRCR